MLRWRARPAGTDLEDHHCKRAVRTPESLMRVCSRRDPNSFHRHCGATLPRLAAVQAFMLYEHSGPDPTIRGTGQKKNTLDKRYPEESSCTHARQRDLKFHLSSLLCVIAKSLSCFTPNNDMRSAVLATSAGWSKKPMDHYWRPGSPELPRQHERPAHYFGGSTVMMIC